jgi:hypothetical protein
VTAQVTIPTGAGVSIVPGSFNIAPTNTVTGTGSETLEWDFAFAAGNTSETITFQEAVTGLAAGQSLPVVQEATVQFTTAPLAAETVDVDPEVNANLQTYSNGVNYPAGGTMLNVGGVPFTLADYRGGGTGVVQTASASRATPSVIDFPVSVANPTTVYTLINSGFGQLGYTAGSVEFIGTGGADATFDLVEGQNIRDHNNFVFNNTIAPGTPSVYFGGGQVRLDRQTFVLPSSFAGQTLTDIRLSGFGDNPTGEPFLAAVTVATTTGMVATDTLTLPGQIVTGDQIIGLSPPTQPVTPAAPANYNVTLANPTDSPITYTLSLQGVRSSWVSLPSSVTVAAGVTTSAPLTLTSDAFAAAGDYGFSVTASDPAGASQSVTGDFVLQGQAAPADTDSRGVVVTLTPTQADAGPGAPARYVVQVSNTGSAAESFFLTTSGLTKGIVASFGESFISMLPPGTSNYLNVPLTLTPPPGTASGTVTFTVTASGESLVTASATGIVVVQPYGISVSVSPSSALPGTLLEATVTNTGSLTDTFGLMLTGPGAQAATLATTSVTLAPGASQTIPIRTSAVNFAVPGNLSLTAIATSQGDPNLKAAASASLTIGSTAGLTAEFQNGVQVLPIPGTTSFLLLVTNTGNTPDEYSAMIMGTSGPLTASLNGLTGQQTQSIPTFTLPGLTSGAIVVNADLAGAGHGTVTVMVQSLTNPAESKSETAMVSTTSTPTPTPAPTPTPTSTSTPTPTPTTTPTPPAPATSPVTVTSFVAEKVAIGTKRHAKKALALGVGFSGALSTAAAEDLAAYTVFSGKIKKVHKISQVIYNKLVPLHEAIYFPASNTVALLSGGKHTLPKLEQLLVNVSLLTDPAGRPINNGKNFKATVTHTGLVISTDARIGSAAIASSSASAVDALFEQGMVASTRLGTRTSRT